ncbi:MAG TPA: TraR/DksA C4-type zinc finger protein [Tepidisphaeraceae bacterium]|nr:TraR/DksA C4-type zinc finger protein [Tepidisphaeraceae bacterium]
MAKAAKASRPAKAPRKSKTTTPGKSATRATSRQAALNRRRQAAKQPTKPAKKTSSARPTQTRAAAKPLKRAAPVVEKEAKTKVVGKVVPALAQQQTPSLNNNRSKLPSPPPAVLPARVPTDGKPRKNQAGLTAKELEHFRELLLAKRREIVGDMSSMEREALRSTTGTNLSNLPLHMADMGTDNYEQEFTLGLVEKDRQLLREINHALAKIQNGTYGICEGTGKPISKARLEAQPWARYSIEYARELEKRGVRR